MMSEMEWLRNFGKNLEYFLQQRRMSQSELARLTGLTQASISRYIQAQQMPGPRAIVNIAAVLCVTTDDLINYDDLIVQ